MRLKYEFVTQEIDGKTAAVAVGQGADELRAIIQLNGTGALLFDRLKTDASEDELAELLVERFDIDAEAARADVRAFAGQLDAAGALER